MHPWGKPIFIEEYIATLFPHLDKFVVVFTNQKQNYLQKEIDCQTWNEKIDHAASNETATILWIQRSNSIHYWKVNLYVGLSTSENFFIVLVLLVGIIWSPSFILQNQVLEREKKQFLKKEFFADVAHGKMGWDGRIT